MFNPCDDLKKVMDKMNIVMKETEIEVNTNEEKHVNEVLKKYDVILGHGVEETDLILEYKTFYNQLNEYILNKRSQIKNFEDATSDLSAYINVGNLKTVLNKKKDNLNRIIDCVNGIVEKIKTLEISICDNKIKKLDDMKLEKYSVDSDMVVINDSLNVLKEWSVKNTFNIIFDSKFDGDGDKNVLHDIVLNKSNLYFTSFDGNNNVFGGYINNKIHGSGDFVHDENAFIFSLIKNGIVKNKKYSIKQDKNKALCLWNNDLEGALYKFGSDICVWKVGKDQSWCRNNDKNCWYNYEDDDKPFTDITYPKRFEIQRIVVIQMN
ncbi:TLDc domain-containing protein [Entamoeba marina]